MTSQDQLTLLRRGMDAWNQWRMGHSTIKPDLSRADLRDADLAGSNLAGSNLTGAHLAGARIIGADLRQALLTGARITGADLREALLTGALLSRADLREADLREADLAGSNLTGAYLAGSRFTRSHLAGAYLTGAHLFGADLTGADLTGADLTGADLRQANLTRARLRRADLREADLTQAHMGCADLTEAHLMGARLNGTVLAGATLANADLSGARLDKANLAGADLSGCRVYAMVAKDYSVDGRTRQADLIVTQIGQSVIAVDSLDMAQFMSLLLENESMRALADAMAVKIVLFVGRRAPGTAMVRDIVRQEGTQKGIVPVWFESKPQGLEDSTGSLEMLSRLARFIVVDISSAKSVPPDLGAILSRLTTTPVLPLTLEGSSSGDVPEAWRENAWLLKTHDYTDEAGLRGSLRKVIDLCESLAEGPGGFGASCPLQ